AFVLSQDQTLQTNPDSNLKETPDKGFNVKLYWLQINTLLSSQTTHAHPSQTNRLIKGASTVLAARTVSSEPTATHSTTRCGSLVRGPSLTPVPLCLAASGPGSRRRGAKLHGRPPHGQIGFP